MFRTLLNFRKRARATGDTPPADTEAEAENPLAPFCEVRMQPIRELLGYVRPEFQRTVNEAHVDGLVRDIEADWRSCGGLSVLQSLSVASLPDDTYYILDGSHRMAAFARLVGGALPALADSALPVVLYRCHTQDEVLHWYARINHNLPIHPLELELAWANKIKPLLELVQRRWRAYLSKSTAPQCPNVHLPHLQSVLQERAAQLQADAITAEGLVEDLEAWHREARRWREAQLRLRTFPRLEKCVAKQPDDPCFLGLFRHGEWLDLLLHRRLHGLSDWSAVDWASLAESPSSGRRSAIPKPVRREVWAKTNPAGAMQGACYVCQEPLQFDDMECAHDVPHCLGGATNVANLWPTCRTCNRDMGVRRLEDYRNWVAQLRSL